MEFSLANLQPKERASFALRALYEAAGCRKYHMGRFEEYGLYQANRSFLSSEQVITFTDLDGRLLALKPDVTLSIAKTAQPAPGETLRYYYHENVYRPSAESHTFKEISQMGLEVIGRVGEAEVQQAVFFNFFIHRFKTHALNISHIKSVCKLRNNRMQFSNQSLQIFINIFFYFLLWRDITLNKSINFSIHHV